MSKLSTEGVRAIVFSGEELPQLEFFELMNETRVFGRQFLLGLRAVGGVRFFFGELPQRFEISYRPLKLTQRIEERAKPRDFLDLTLSAFAIRPKIGGRHALFQAPKLTF